MKIQQKSRQKVFENLSKKSPTKKTADVDETYGYSMTTIESNSKASEVFAKRKSLFSNNLSDSGMLKVTSLPKFTEMEQMYFQKQNEILMGVKQDRKKQI